jgi:hypothetical protein
MRSECERCADFLPKSQTGYRYDRCKVYSHLAASNEHCSAFSDNGGA